MSTPPPLHRNRSLGQRLRRMVLVTITAEVSGMALLATALFGLLALSSLLRMVMDIPWLFELLTILVGAFTDLFVPAASVLSEWLLRAGIVATPVVYLASRLLDMRRWGALDLAMFSYLANLALFVRLLPEHPSPLIILGLLLHHLVSALLVFGAALGERRRRP